MISEEKLQKLPQRPGVYFFRNTEGEIIYIGKATNLKNRVSSYFMNGPKTNRPIEAMIHEVVDIAVEQTDSVMEALILESNLIKKYQPKYNVLEKDDKSFAYFVITKEEFPRVVILRKTDLDRAAGKRIGAFDAKLPARIKDMEVDTTYGPYLSKRQMEIVLKIVRRIFPFHALKQKSEKGCLDFQLGKCPGPHAGAISQQEYKKNIRGIRMILEGKKKGLIKALEKEMAAAAKKEEFEKAAELRNKIYALEHIRDIALISREYDNLEFPISNFESNQNNKISKIETLEIQSKLKIQNSKFRIEAYDISNISGQHAVGSMVVFENGKPSKSQYRKFKIKTIEGSNDVAMMREVLLRRFGNDWPMPDLILLDGGQGHANMMSELVMRLGLDVLVVAVAKGQTRKNLNFQFPISNKFPMTQFPKGLQNFLNDKNLVKQIMDEAHRFAITYHRKVRGKNALQ